MTKELAKDDKLPNEIILLARGAEGEVDKLIQSAELEGYELSREQARGVLRHITDEAEQDDAVSAPSGVDVLLRKTDRILNNELQKLERDIKLYDRVSEKDPKFNWEVNGEEISIEEAIERKQVAIARVLEIKKNLTDGKKAELAANNTQVNLSVNMGDLVSEALSNIEEKSQGVDLPVVTVE